MSLLLTASQVLLLILAVIPIMSFANRCSNLVPPSPACAVLNQIYGLQGKPDLLLSIKLLSRVLKDDRSDWVLLEHLGGSFFLLSRRIMSSEAYLKNSSVRLQAEDLLRKAVSAFEAAWPSRMAFEGSDSSRAAFLQQLRRPQGTGALDMEYPQADFATPLSRVVRSWGDALAWLNRTSEAKAVFYLGVKKGFWKSAMCRVDGELPTRLASDDRRPFIWRNVELFSSLFRGQGDLSSSLSLEQKIFRTIVPEWNGFVVNNNVPESGEWRDESAGLHSGKSWTQLPLVVNGKPEAGGCKHFPQLCELLLSFPNTHIRSGQAKLSRMRGGEQTVVRPHTGPVNTRLRMHCTVSLPPVHLISESWIRVGSTNTSWEEGQCFAFDESCEHEVVFRSVKGEVRNRDRVVLIVDFANPFLGESDYVEAHQQPFRDGARVAHKDFLSREDPLAEDL
jgi:hypothetical protein